MGLKWRATPAACNSDTVVRCTAAITMSRGSKNGNVIARCEMYTENDRIRGGERLTSVNSVRKEPSGNDRREDSIITGCWQSAAFVWRVLLSIRGGRRVIARSFVRSLKRCESSTSLRATRRDQPALLEQGSDTHRIEFASIFQSKLIPLDGDES